MSGLHLPAAQHKKKTSEAKAMEFAAGHSHGEGEGQKAEPPKSKG